MSSIGNIPPPITSHRSRDTKQAANPRASNNEQRGELKSSSYKRGTFKGFINQFRPDLTAAQQKDKLDHTRQPGNFLNGPEPRVAVVDLFSRAGGDHGDQVVDVLETQVKPIQISQFHRHSKGSLAGGYSNALDDVLRKSKANGPFDYVNLSVYNSVPPRVLAGFYNEVNKDNPEHVDIGSNFEDWSEEERKSLLNFMTTEFADNIDAHKEAFFNSYKSARSRNMFSALTELSKEMRDAIKLMDMGTTIVTTAGNEPGAWNTLSLLTSLNNETRGKAYVVAGNTQSVFATTENSSINSANPRDGVADYSSVNHANAKAGGYTPKEDFGEEAVSFGTSFSAPDFIANDIAARTGQDTPLPKSERDRVLGPSDRETISTGPIEKPVDTASPPVDEEQDADFDGILGEFFAELEDD